MPIIKPDALFGVSFQMSFLCVLLIAGVGVPVVERTLAPYAHGLRSLDALAYDRSLPPRIAQFRIDLRLVLRRVERLGLRQLPQHLLITGLRGAFGIAHLVVLSAVM